MTANNSDTHSTEQLIDELSEQITEEWYAAQDWGQDKFTEVMCNEEIPNDVAVTVFEATCYYVVQNLVYSGQTDVLEKIANERGFRLVPIAE